MIKKKIKKVDSSSIQDVEHPKKMEQPLRLFHPLDNVSKMNIKFWISKFKEKYRPAKCVLINFETLAGFHTHFLVTEKDGGFKYGVNQYVFDEELKYYVISAKLWAYDFHEGFTLPIKRRIPINEIRKSIVSSKITDVEYATNPRLIKEFMTSKIAEGIMKGSALDSWMRQMKLFLIIVMVATIIHLILFVNASGMLANLNLPF